jgi:hypothetical protein
VRFFLLLSALLAATSSAAQPADPRICVRAAAASRHLSHGEPASCASAERVERQRQGRPPTAHGVCVLAALSPPACAVTVAGRRSCSWLRCRWGPISELAGKSVLETLARSTSVRVSCSQSRDATQGLDVLIRPVSTRRQEHLQQRGCGHQDGLLIPAAVLDSLRLTVRLLQESVKSRVPQLHIEYKFYKALAGLRAFPADAVTCECGH